MEPSSWAAAAPTAALRPFGGPLPAAWWAWGTLLKGGFSSEARDVSNDGTVIVGYGTNSQRSEAFRWTSTGGMVGLGHLDGEGDLQSYANAVSGDGAVVVGRSGDEAFRWTQTGGMVGLGTLPGLSVSEARGVSDDGTVVVGDSASWEDGGFLWTQGMGMRNLREFLSNDLGLNLSDWSMLKDVTGISGDGRTITGTGRNSSGTEAWVASFASLPLHWTSGAAGEWDDTTNWTYGFKPGAANQDDVFIDPTAGLTITGPAATTTVDSLTVGAQTTGTAVLALQSDLTATNGVTVQDRGSITLAGQTLNCGTGLTIDGAGSVSGYGLLVGNVGGTTGMAGLSGSDGNYNRTTALAVGADTVTVLSQGMANLGPYTTIAGGTINASNGLFLQGASSIQGNGNVNGRIAAAFGSTITATGNLTLGDGNSYAGFASDGELYTGANTVTINDRNVAVLGTLTQLGDGANGGTLTAGTAMVGDTHAHFLLEEGKTLAGRGTINANFKNQGDVIGDGTGAGERLVFSSDWTVSGNGTFENVEVQGTFAPGNSPSIVEATNALFTGAVEFELGGTDPGFLDSKPRSDQRHGLPQPGRGLDPPRAAVGWFPARRRR